MGGWFEKLYDQEWTRRNELLGAANLPLGVLVLLGSGLALVVKDYDAGGGWLDAWFWASVGVSGLAYVGAGIFLVRSVLGRPYRDLPSPSAILRYRSELRELHGRDADRADREFADTFERRLARVASANRHINVLRGGFLHLCIQATAVACIAFAITLSLFVLRERSVVAHTHDGRTSMSRDPAFASSKSPSKERPTPVLAPNIVIAAYPWQPMIRPEREDEDPPSYETYEPWWRRLFGRRTAS